MSITSLRAGIIGTGFIAPVHIEALRRIGVQVTAVCGSTAGARATADQWAIPEIYGDYDYRALCASPNVDVIHITSPNKLHVEQALAALAAGKHVVCEKPLGMDTKETARVVKAAAKAKTVLAVNYNCRFFPAILQMRASVQRGDLGKIIHVQGHFFQDWLLKESDYNWRLLASEGGKLRAVGDIGTHWIDALSFILDSHVESVFATTETFHKKRLRPARRGKDLRQSRPENDGPLPGGYGGFRQPAPPLRQWRACQCRHLPGRRRLEMLPRPGHLRHRGQHALGSPAAERNPGRPPRRAQPNPPARHRRLPRDVAHFTDYPGGHPEGFPDSHQNELPRHLRTHRQRPEDPPLLFATAGDGHEEVKICEAVLKSAAAGKWVRVPGRD
ncbi:MAG: Gfo/Idh/MocA family oxidoreductase [Chthoniobacter sp.]